MFPIYAMSQNFFWSHSSGTPIINTSAITSITSTTASGGGNIRTRGSSDITARGVCWNTSSDPTVSNSHTTDGSGVGTFTSSLTGLSGGTTYYVRAYGTNTQGTFYGQNVSFTTTLSGIYLQVDALKIGAIDNTYLNCTFTVVNNTASNYYPNVKWRNVTRSSGWVYLYLSTVYLYTTRQVSRDVNMNSVSNYPGDQIEILFSPAGDGVWTGTVVPASPIYLNYN